MVSRSVEFDDSNKSLNHYPPVKSPLCSHLEVHVVHRKLLDALHSELGSAVDRRHALIGRFMSFENRAYRFPIRKPPQHRKMGFPKQKNLQLKQKKNGIHYYGINDPMSVTTLSIILIVLTVTIKEASTFGVSRKDLELYLR